MQIYKLVTDDTLFPQYFESEDELIHDWAYTLGQLLQRWSPYYHTGSVSFSSDGKSSPLDVFSAMDLLLRHIGTLVDPPNDPDRTLSQKVHNRFERSNPEIAGSPEDLVDLLHKMLVFEPGTRPSARELLFHRWFQ